MNNRDGAVPDSGESAMEQKIQDKGLVAPRLTPELIDAKIVAENYHVFEDTCLTVCCLTLQNGFTVTGESACASPENFNEEIGREIAKRNARDKIWSLEGYLLKQKLFDSGKDQVKTGAEILGDYLKESVMEGKTEFRLVGMIDDRTNTVKLYMHPQGKHGKTIDFHVQWDSSIKVVES